MDILFLGVFSGERFHESPLLEEKSPLFSCHCQEAARDSWIEGSIAMCSSLVPGGVSSEITCL